MRFKSLLFFLLLSSNAFAFYHPGIGGFINRDPIEEKGGLNIYAFVGNDSVNYWDYLGLDWVKTNIRFMTGYTKDNPTIPNHWFLNVNGKGYGLYAESHLPGKAPKTLLGTIADYTLMVLFKVNGVVLDSDHILYPNRTYEETPEYLTFSIAQDVEINDCYVDKNKFEKSVGEYAELSTTTIFDYNVLFFQCDTFAEMLLILGLEDALKSKAYYKEYGKYIEHTILRSKDQLYRIK